MPAGNAAILAVLGAYFGLMLAIGVWARRSHDSAAGYFLAGRKLPYWVAAFSMNATGESAWLILGLSGVAYLTGLQALWVVAGEALGVAGAWLLVARRLNAASRDSDTITVPDFLAERFRRQAVAIRGLAVAIILAMACAYIAAQMLATGKAFSVFLGWEYASGSAGWSLWLIPPSAASRRWPTRTRCRQCSCCLRCSPCRSSACRPSAASTPSGRASPGRTRPCCCPGRPGMAPWSPSS